MDKKYTIRQVAGLTGLSLSLIHISYIPRPTAGTWILPARGTGENELP